MRAQGNQASRLSEQGTASARGVSCGGGLVCSLGACSSSCDAGLSACGAACVALASDALHCGACDVACGAGQSCIAGACVASGSGGTSGAGGSSGSAGAGASGATGGSSGGAGAAGTGGSTGATGGAGGSACEPPPLGEPDIPPGDGFYVGDTCHPRCASVYNECRNRFGTQWWAGHRSGNLNNTNTPDVLQFKGAMDWTDTMLTDHLTDDVRFWVSITPI